MAEELQKKPNNNNKSCLNSSSSKESKVSSGEIIGSNSSFSGQKHHYPNQREASIPDAATLRDQWRFAIRQYSKWYSHAWGTAILAGASFFALGWIIKGSNPLPSRKQKHKPNPDDDSIDHLKLLADGFMPFYFNQNNGGYVSDFQ